MTTNQKHAARLRAISELWVNHANQPALLAGAEALEAQGEWRLAAEKPMLLDVWEYGHLTVDGYRVRREIVVEFRQNVAGDFVVVQNADEPDKQLAKQTEQQIKRSEWAAFVAMKTLRRNYASSGAR